MRALLLAAGLGTRLRPLTDCLPKCLVPIHGRPLLDYWMERLFQGGIERVLVNLHYMAPIVQSYLEQSGWMSRVTLVDEPMLLGTGGTVLANREFFRDEPFLVAHADNLTIFNVEDFAHSHLRRPEQSVMTMMIFESEEPWSCGIVELDGNGIVRAFHEKVPDPPGNTANAAVYIFEPHLIEMLVGAGKAEIDLSTEIIPHLVGRINTYKNDRYHRDIGSMSSWRAANRDFPAGPVSPRSASIWAALYAKANQECQGRLTPLLDALARS